MVIYQHINSWLINILCLLSLALSLCSALCIFIIYLAHFPSHNIVHSLRTKIFVCFVYCIISTWKCAGTRQARFTKWVTNLSWPKKLYVRIQIQNDQELLKKKYWEGANKTNINSICFDIWIYGNRSMSTLGPGICPVKFKMEI